MVDIYELLNKIELDAVKLTQLNSAQGRTKVDVNSVSFWQGVAMVSHAIGASRTFAHGLPIYETGKVHIETIDDSADATITPTGTEVWYVQNLQIDNCEAAFRDGDGNVSPITVASANSLLPFYMSAKMSLMLSNGSGSQQTPSIAYHKVSL